MSCDSSASLVFILSIVGNKKLKLKFAISLSERQKSPTMGLPTK